jgi:hypothetical protein
MEKVGVQGRRGRNKGVRDGRVGKAVLCGETMETNSDEGFL